MRSGAASEGRPGTVTNGGESVIRMLMLVCRRFLNADRSKSRASVRTHGKGSRRIIKRDLNFKNPWDQKFQRNWGTPASKRISSRRCVKEGGPKRQTGDQGTVAEFATATKVSRLGVTH